MDFGKEVIIQLMKLQTAQTSCQIKYIDYVNILIRLMFEIATSFEGRAKRTQLRKYQHSRYIQV